MDTTTWRVELYFYEDGDRTRAEAVLRTDAGTEVRGSGSAYRSPRDRDVPEIGEELAASRALAALAHQLFETTVLDVEQNVGAEAHLHA